MNALILSCSLNPDSRSAHLAEAARKRFEALGAETELVDLRKTPLPLCDGQATHEDPAVLALGRKIRDADAILLAVPIYNYYANAAAKNMIELTSYVWRDKVLGFVCAAGGQTSYMSLMSLANTMMLDFRCLIVPRFVYATADDVSETGELVEDMARRVDQLCREMLRVAGAVRPDNEAAGV